MAINIDTQDVDQYPGNIKRVTVDQEKIVPTGFEGDEQYVITVSTSAYSDNTNNTAIQDLYIMEYDAGWCKSNGLAGTGGKFALDSTHNRLKIKMDATVSGSDGSGYYTIILDHNSGIGITGEAIAEDMEEKIRAITCVTADTGYQLAYTNASVEFTNGRFWIISGNISRYYTGTYRSSVDVQPAATNDCSSLLGFDIPVRSEEIASIAVGEALLASNYTANTTPLLINTGTGVQVGDCMAITDGNNIDYFPVLGVVAGSITVPVSGTNGFVGIAHDYTTASGSMVQVLRKQDPDVKPISYFTSVDSLIRYGIKSIINQIDYSS